MISLRDVVEKLGIPCDTNRREAIIECPNCGRKKLSLCFAKDVYNCPACGEVHGNAMDLWAYYHGISRDTQEDTRKAAYKSYMSSDQSGIPLARTDVKPEPKELPLASSSSRGKAYSAMMSEMTLTDRHRKNLLRRGLSDEDIDFLGIKTMPGKAAGEQLIKKLNGIPLDGIPGIYGDKSKKLVSYKKRGMLIPQKDFSGRIQGCQIRFDTGDPKYVFFSSAGYENGTSAKAFIHWAVRDYSSYDCTRVILTEGPLKADIINKYTGLPVIAIPGVGSIKELGKALDVLKRKGMKILYIAFDMDYLTNPNVKNALSKLESLLIKKEIRFKQLRWDPAYKGLDDYLTRKQTG